MDFSLNILLFIGLTLVLQQIILFVPYTSHDQILFFFFWCQKARVNYYFQSKSYCLRVSLYIFPHNFSYCKSYFTFFFLLSTFSKKIKINSQLISFSFQLLSIVILTNKLGKLFPNIKCLLISLEGSNEKKKKSKQKIFQLYFTYQPIVCFVCCYLHFQLISKVFKSMKQSCNLRIGSTSSSQAF